MKHMDIKPGKGQSLFGFIIGIIFCIIGLTVVMPTAGAFGLLWTGMAVAITVINGLNAFTDKGVPTHQITIDDEGKEWENDPENTVESRLNQLNELYQKGLLNKEEYDKRSRTS